MKLNSPLCELWKIVKDNSIKNRKKSKYLVPAVILILMGFCFVFPAILLISLND